MPKPTIGQKNWGQQLNAFLDEKQDVATRDADTAADITNVTSATGAALLARYGRGLSVAAFGAKGDGTTDDTAAIQAAINAAETGESVYFPQTGSGAFYKITSTLTVTTPNLRLIGQPRDAYAMSIRCAVASTTMIVVKASGFVMQDVSLYGDSSTTNGVGATVTGLDLFGTTDGDVDALVTGCSFQGLALGILNRGRNTTIERSLFSNSLDGVRFTGKDATYHTGPNADQNRGNAVRDNRFHNIGAASTDAALEITDTAKVLHAIISGNHFDSSGEGKHIVATGTVTSPHAKLTILNNKHTEMRAAGVQLTYVNNSVIRGAYMAGDTAATSSDYNGITLNNCDTVLVTDTFGLQLGTSGIYARNCVRLRARSVDFRALGVCTTTTANGFDIDATNSGCEFESIVVEGTDGYGFTGAPVSSRLGSHEFTSCATGRFNSTVFGPPVIVVPAQNMTAITGTPNLVGVPGIDYPESYQFDQATAEQVTMQVPDIPDDWRTFDIVLWWAATNSSAGNVVWASNYSWMTAGTTPAADAASAGNDTGAAPGIAGQIVETTLIAGVARKNAALQFRLTRAAADAGDTYAADAAVVAVRLVRAS